MMIPTIQDYGRKLKQIRNKQGDGEYWHTLRKLLTNDFLYLCYALGFTDVGNPFHVGLMSWIQRFEGQSLDRGLALLPRGHLKTSIITAGWSIRNIIRRNGNVRIAITSCSEDIAHVISGSIKEICQNNEILVKAFPNIFYQTINPNISPWRDDAFRLKGLPDYVREATIESWDINTPPTSRHYDIIMMDDPIDRRSCEKPEHRARMRESFDLCTPLLEPGGTRIVVGTFWHFYDIYNDILAGRKGPGWETLKKPAKDNDGRMLWPERFTDTKAEAKDLIARYKAQGVKKPKVVSLESLQDEMAPSTFYAQYMLKVLPPEDVLFRPEDIILMDPPDKGEKSYIIGVDPAKTTKEYSAKTAIVVLSIYENKQMFVEEVINDKLHTPEIMDLIFRLMATYPGKLAVEKTGWNDIIRLIEEEQGLRNVFFEIIEKHPKDSKEDRVKNILELPIKRKQLHFRRNLERNRAYNELRAQILDFPQCAYWDAIDALTWAVSEAEHPGEPAEAPKEKPEGRFNDRLEALMEGKRGFATRTVWR